MQSDGKIVYLRRSGSVVSCTYVPDAQKAVMSLPTLSERIEFLRKGWREAAQRERIGRVLWSDDVE